MEYIKKTAEGIAKHALEVISRVDKEQVELMIECINEADSTFIVGIVRSELVVMSFSMRWRHLGFGVYVG